MSEGLAYYNEHDHKAATWLRELIAQGHIAAGDVDTRDIQEVQPDELRPYRQVHLFAGIGGWSRALRLAGWPDDRAVWTGSCPCQPFSAAGKRKGVKDKRHLWPDMRRLLSECRPAICFGEQVASADGRDWLAGVRADLEAMAYEVGAADLCAASIGEKAFETQAEQLRWLVACGDARVRGREQVVLAFADYLDRLILSAPHIRQRLWWVAHPNGRIARNGELQPGGQQRQQPQDGCATDWLADAEPERARERIENIEGQARSGRNRLAINGAIGGLVNVLQPRLEGYAGHGDDGSQPGRLNTYAAGPVAAAGNARGLGDGKSGGRGIVGDASLSRSGRHPLGSSWAGCQTIQCRDGKSRRIPIEPAFFPLAYGVPARVVRLRGYGNAIVPEVAATFIQTCEEVISSLLNDTKPQHPQQVIGAVSADVPLALEVLVDLRPADVRNNLQGQLVGSELPSGSGADDSLSDVGLHLDSGEAA